MYQDQEEVQEKYFGRAQNKIVQGKMHLILFRKDDYKTGKNTGFFIKKISFLIGMTAKEKIPGKLSSFNIRKRVDITAVKSFRY